MQFCVHDEIFNWFPGLTLAVVIAEGIDNSRVPPEVSEEWRKTWRRAGQQAAAYGNAQSHPHVRPWRERLRALGVASKFPSSIEALLRRALKGGEPFSINGLVDFYNTISLRHVVPVGGFDLEQVGGPLELRLTREGDHFIALGEEEPQQVQAGEVAYTDGNTILTRHFVWRQARQALILPQTRRVFLVSESLGEVGPQVAQAVLEDLVSGLQRCFAAQVRPFLLSASNPQATW
ncbi:B3/4 domain-containing protein [Thermogemmatispora sp.]|uniref:B3/B4 domain-containing protein n=1 Tax=Thermogemmatispora sp. TaxID=1968838 RepID=UPI0035E40491